MIAEVKNFDEALIATDSDVASEHPLFLPSFALVEIDILLLRAALGEKLIHVLGHELDGAVGLDFLFKDVEPDHLHLDLGIVRKFP